MYYTDLAGRTSYAFKPVPGEEPTLAGTESKTLKVPKYRNLAHGNVLLKQRLLIVLAANIDRRLCYFSNFSSIAFP